MERAEGTGLDWTHRRLHYLLTNENYTGDCLANKTTGLAGGHSLSKKYF